ncbi:uncharacterized protein [Engystomops pustulosus]|uniref:uncharacterized protein n=1 Tax=Engystomops pustulosus TaxID=76066 RepID=UPI003AFB0716
MKPVAMRLPGFLCFLSALVATGDSLQCLTCQIISVGPCTTTTPEICLDGQVCAFQSTISVKYGEIKFSFKSFCAEKKECYVNGTFTDYSSVTRIATTCCSSDSCTPEKPTIPSPNPKVPNGFLCPKCTLPGTSLCDQYMQCTGNETKCLLESTTTSQGTQTDLSLNGGCASSGYCLRNKVNYTTNGFYKEITYTCTNGSRADDLSNSTLVTTTISADNGTSMCGFSLSAAVYLSILLILLEIY